VRPAKSCVSHEPLKLIFLLGYAGMSSRGYKRRSRSMATSDRWRLARSPLIPSNLAGAISARSTWRVGISCYGGMALKGHAGRMCYGAESETTWRGSGERWEETSKQKETTKSGRVQPVLESSPWQLGTNLACWFRAYPRAI
jgi:hypothetical protein